MTASFTGAGCGSAGSMDALPHDQPILPPRAWERMFVERLTVSRKTPGDGKLEISSAAAEHLRRTPAALEIEIGTLLAPATVEMFTCTCQKVGHAHEHHFVTSEVLKALQPATLVDLQLITIRDDAGARTRVAVLPVSDSPP